MTSSGPRRNVALMLSTIVVAIVVTAVWIGVTHDWSGATGDSSDLASDQSSGLRMFAQADRVPVPTVSGLDLNGKPLSLADFPDKVLVLNVWGSWCAPCRAEAPDLASVSAATRTRGVQFIGVDTRDNPAAALSFEKQFGIEYPSFDDRDGKVLINFNEVVPISAVPSTVFVDADGLVAARIVGRVDATTLKGIIDDLLSERDAGPSEK